MLIVLDFILIGMWKFKKCIQIFYTGNLYFAGSYHAKEIRHILRKNRDLESQLDKANRTLLDLEKGQFSASTHIHPAHTYTFTHLLNCSFYHLHVVVHRPTYILKLTHYMYIHVHVLTYGISSLTLLHFLTHS